MWREVEMAIIESGVSQLGMQRQLASAKVALKQL
jgi:hypothetical protein